MTLKVKSIATPITPFYSLGMTLITPSVLLIDNSDNSSCIEVISYLCFKSFKVIGDKLLDG